MARLVRAGRGRPSRRSAPAPGRERVDHLARRLARRHRLRPSEVGHRARPGPAAARARTMRSQSSCCSAASASARLRASQAVARLVGRALRAREAPRTPPRADVEGRARSSRAPARLGHAASAERGRAPVVPTAGCRSRSASWRMISCGRSAAARAAQRRRTAAGRGRRCAARPAVGLEALAHVLAERELGLAVDGDAVVVVDPDQLAELEWPASEAASLATPSIRSPSLSRARRCGD